MDYDTEDNFNATVSTYSKQFTTGQYRFYYFGDASDGSMKTGKQTVEIDGDSFTFKFKDSTSSKGAAVHGEDDDKLYNGGKLIKSDKDEKYQAVLYVESTDDADEMIYMTKLDIDDFLAYFTDGGKPSRNGATEYTGEPDADLYSVHKDQTLVEKVNELLEDNGVGFEVKTNSEDKKEDKEEDKAFKITNAEVHLYLVNTSGSLVKNKAAAKDGSDYKFEVDNYEIESVTMDY